MKLGGDLIYVLTFVVVIENPTPLVNFILFSISKSFDYIRRKAIKIKSCDDPLANIKRCPWVYKSLWLILPFLYFNWLARVNSFIQLRAYDEIMKNNVLFWFLFASGFTLGIHLREKSVTQVHFEINQLFFCISREFKRKMKFYMVKEIIYGWSQT